MPGNADPKVGVAPSTTTVTMPNGETYALGDWIDDRLYGTVQFDNGSSGQVEGFSAGRSQQIPGGRRNQLSCDTNLPRNGDNGLPKDWEAQLFGIAIKPVRAMRVETGGSYILPDQNGAYSDPLRLRTLFNLDRVLFFQFYYNGKVYSEGTLADFPQGNGYNVFATTTSFELAQNGAPSPRDRIAMVLPIRMRENLGYKGIMSPQAALVINQPASDGGAVLTGVDVKVSLNSLIKRTVV